MAMSGNISDMEGYLTKQGGLVRNWKRRWFVLRGNKLLYYRSKGDNEAAGVIVLGSSSRVSVATKKTGKKHSFEVHTGDRDYFLVADDAVSMENWMKNVTKATTKGQENITTETPTIVLQVKGMMCDRCSKHVKKAVYQTPGVENVAVDYEDGTVTITGSADMMEITERLEEAGFHPISIPKK